MHRFIKLLETFLRDLGPFDIRVSHSCCRFIGGSSTLHFSLWQISTWLTWYLRCFAFTDLNTGDKGKTKISLLCVPLITSSQSLDPIFFHTVFLFLFFWWWWYEALLTDFKLGWHLVKGKSGALSAVKKCLTVHYDRWILSTYIWTNMLFFWYIYQNIFILRIHVDKSERRN